MAIASMQLSLNEKYPPKKYKIAENDLRWLQLIYNEHQSSLDATLKLIELVSMKEIKELYRKHFKIGEDKVVWILSNASEQFYNDRRLVWEYDAMCGKFE